MAKGKTYLLLDCNNLCHRAFQTTKHLSYEDQPTGVIYGFLRNLSRLQSNFNTSRLIFCFDYGPTYRENLGVGYKEIRRQKHREAPEEERLLVEEMREQMDKLRTTHLKKLGFKNVLSFKGYEADDLIGSIIKTNLYRMDKHQYDRAVIVSSDKDYYQLLTDRVVCYDSVKGQCMTKAIFMKEYGCEPKYWARIKAIIGKAGEVEGLKGIGIKTACKFFGKDPKLKDEALQQILDFMTTEQYTTNLLLSKIPYPDTPIFELVKDRCDRNAWLKFVRSLGMNSLEREIPIYGN